MENKKLQTEVGLKTYESLKTVLAAAKGGRAAKIQRLLVEVETGFASETMFIAAARKFLPEEGAATRKKS